MFVSFGLVFKHLPQDPAELMLMHEKCVIPIIILNDSSYWKNLNVCIRPLVTCSSRYLAVKVFPKSWRRPKAEKEGYLFIDI